MNDRRIDPQRISDSIDKTVSAATDIDMSLGGVQFKSMIELMEFAKMMAVSDCAVPPHLRNNPGACLAICTKAVRNNFDPFSLAEHSFAMEKEVSVSVTSAQGGRSEQKEKVKTIAYDSFVISAIINAHAPIEGRMAIAFSGEGMDRRCTVSATHRDSKQVVSHTSPTLGERIKAIGVSEKGHIKGSPLWVTKPDQQLAYDTRRDFCRMHFPEVLLGWYDKDEFDENVRAERAVDVTPKPDVGTRLVTDRSTGFSSAKIDDAVKAATVTEETNEKPAEGEQQQPVQESQKSAGAKADDAKGAGKRPSARRKAETPAPPADPKPAEEPEQPTQEPAAASDDQRVAEEPPATRETSFEDAEETVRKMGDEISKVEDLDEYKKRCRSMIDALEGLTDDERDILKGRLSTMVLTEQRTRGAKKGGKK